MSEYSHRKAVRLKINEETAKMIFNVGDRWDIVDYLEHTPFETAPTDLLFIDYPLPCDNDGEGNWGKVRKLYPTEYDKYSQKFSKLLKNSIPIYEDDLRVVEYCFWNGTESEDYFDETTYHDDFYDEV